MNDAELDEQNIWLPPSAALQGPVPAGNIIIPKYSPSGDDQRVQLPQYKGV